MKEWCKKYGLLALILAVVLGEMLYYGSKKEGYHVDEMYSYGLANSEYLPFMHFGESGYDVKDWMLEYGAGESFGDLCRNLANDLRILAGCGFHLKESVIYQDFLIARDNSATTRVSTWLPGQEYQDYLAVSESNTFNYASVYYNQRGDVHPPLFYMVLHTVCSVFQGSFSKWYALGINMAFLLLTIFLLYITADRHFGGGKLALAATAVYALSVGILSNAMYLRMYAILTFMTLFFFYEHLEIAKKDFVLKGRDRVKLVLAALGGFLTHYYFIPYAIAVAAVFLVWLCGKRRWKAVWNYLFTLTGASVIGLCVWPFAIRHVFGGYRGYEALQIMSNREFYLIKIKVILYQLGQQLLGGQEKWFLFPLFFVILFVLVIVNRKKSCCTGKTMMLLIPILGYVSLVSQIVPMSVDRYFMNMFPLCALMIVVCVRECAVTILGHRRLAETKPGKQREKIGICAALAAALCVVIVNNGVVNTPGYLYLGGQETATVPENADCIYVLQDGSWNVSAVDSCILARCRRVGVAYEPNLECLADGYRYAPGEWVILAVSEELDPDEVLEETRQMLGLQAEERFREDGGTSIRIYLQTE